KTIRVKVSAEHAFDVFTSGLGRWWPRDKGIGKLPMKTAVMETRLGGRWYEVAEGGTGKNVGRSSGGDPPRRFVMTWGIAGQWKPDTTVSAEVEVTFTPESPDATRVELEHRKFERMGPEAGESMRRHVDGGWPGMLERFRTEAEGR